MSSAETLRAKQNMEVLDVWKNLQSQVNAITKKQISVFPDTLRPKTERDIDTEVNVDKSIEGLNTTLESRLASLEFVIKNDKQLGVQPRGRPSAIRPVVVEEEEEPSRIPEIKITKEMSKAEREEADRHNASVARQYKEELQRYRERQAERERVLREQAKASSAEAEQRGLEKGISQAQSLPFQKAFQEVLNTGVIVSQWNAIVRYYTKQGLSKQSQEMIKVKVKDLEPNLDAMLYGLDQVVEALFGFNRFTDLIGMKILEVLRSVSIYQIVKQQVNTSSFELISVAMMDTSFKNIFAELSQQRRELLAEVSQRGEPNQKRPLRIIPDFDTTSFQARMKELMDELGVRSLPDDLVARLKKMNRADFMKYADSAIREAKAIAPRHPARSDPEGIRLINEYQALVARVRVIYDDIHTNIPRDIRMLETQNDYLRSGGDGDEKMMELPPAGVFPALPNVMDYTDADGDVSNEWSFVITEYNDAYAKAQRMDEERIRAEEHNRIAEEARRADEVRREELIRRNEAEIQRLTELELPSAEQTLEEITEQKNAIEEQIDTMNLSWAMDAIDALKELEDSFKKQRTMGKGKPKGADIDTRGLASMRHHYGAKEKETSSDEDSDEESSSDEEDVFDFDDRRNEMYYSKPKKWAVS